LLNLKNHPSRAVSEIKGMQFLLEKYTPPWTALYFIVFENQLRAIPLKSVEGGEEVPVLEHGINPHFGTDGVKNSQFWYGGVKTFRFWYRGLRVQKSQFWYRV